jgi:hypothetical protein
MFDLESQIRAWRSDLAAAMGNVPDALDELESHLRDDIDRRIQRGAGAQSAFEAARAQLGEPARLAQEFARTRERRWIPGWIAIGTVAAAVLVAAIREAARASSGKVQPLMAGHVIAVVGGYVAMLAVGMLAAWSVLSATILRRSPARNRRALQPVALKLSIVATIMTTIAVVTGAFWAREHLGRYWGFDLKETGGAAVILWSLLLVAMAIHAARHPSRMTALLLASLAGNIVVTLSWFGPALISGGSTFARLSGPLLATFILLQLVLMAWQAMRGGRAEQKADC